MADNAHEKEQSKPVDNEGNKEMAVKEPNAHRGAVTNSDGESEVDRDILSLSIDEELEKSILNTSTMSEEDTIPTSPLIKLQEMKIEEDDAIEPTEHAIEETANPGDGTLPVDPNTLGAAGGETHDPRSKLRERSRPPGSYVEAHTGRTTPVAKSSEKESKPKKPRATSKKTASKSEEAETLKTAPKATEAPSQPEAINTIQQSTAGPEHNQATLISDLKEQMKKLNSTIKDKDREIARLKADNILLKTENNLTKQELDEKHTEATALRSRLNANMRELSAVKEQLVQTLIREPSSQGTQKPED